MAESPETEPQRSTSRLSSLLTTLFMALCLVPFVIAAPLLGYDRLHANHIFPGVEVLGVPVGGMTQAEAQAALSAPIAALEGQTLTLRYDDRSWTATAAELGLHYDLEATVEQAFNIGRGQGLVQDNNTRLDLLLAPQKLGATIQTNPVRTLEYLQRLAREIDTTMRNASVKIENLQVVTTTAQIGRRLDIEASANRVAQALATGKGGEVDLVVTAQMPLVPDSGIAEAAATLEKLISAPVTVTFSSRDWVLAGGVVASPKPVERRWTVDRAQLAAAVVMEQRKSGDQVVITARLDGNKFAALFTTIAKELNQTPQNARFDRDGRTGKLTPLQVSREGRTVDTAESLKRLVAASGSNERTVQLAVKITPPAVAVDQADKMGFKDLLSQGLSSYAGSRPARAYNIQYASTKLHGVVVPPGGVFSLLDAIGPITAQAGYQEGYAIVGEYTVQDVGGGVCQVATTTFRAFYRGGFEIVERNPHRYRLRVYEIKGGFVGLDAAVYDPGRDLRFRNNSKGYILVQTDTSDPSNYTVSIYGTNPGWSVTIGDPVIRPGKPHGERLPDVLDPNLPVGTRIPVQPAEDGLIVTITREVRQGTTVILKDTLETTYLPANEQWIVGTKK